MKFQEYFDEVLKMVGEVRETQAERIMSAARLVSEAVSKGGIIHTLGVGHSHCLAEDVFFRAGTLVPIHAILEPSMTGHSEMVKSAYMEKLEGAGAIMMEYHKVLPPDVLIVISNSGNNNAPIDAALEAQRRNVPVIAIASVEYANKLPPRHSSGRKLTDVATVLVDNRGKYGDTCLNLEGLEQGVGPTSTITGSFILNAVLVQAAANLVEEGIKPEIYWSGNLPGGMEANAGYLEAYWSRIRNL
jgi:uncharacterized phosphosugar-binding protein